MVAGGDVVYAEDANTLLVAPVGRMIQQATQTLAHNTAVQLSWTAGSEAWDSDGFHSEVSQPTRVTPTEAGYYRFVGTVWFASSTYAHCQVYISKNGGLQMPVVRTRPHQTAGLVSVQVSVQQQANGTTDYFELSAQQNQATGTASTSTNVGGGTNSVLEWELIRPL